MTAIITSPGSQVLILIQKDAIPIPWHEDVRSSGNRNLRIQPSRAEQSSPNPVMPEIPIPNPALPARRRRPRLLGAGVRSWGDARCSDVPNGPPVNNTDS